MKSLFKKRGFIIGFVIVVLVIIAGIGIGVSKHTKSTQPNYQVATIKKDAPLLLKGQIAADNTVDVSTTASQGATLTQTNVQDGQHVDQGTVLMTFHDSSVEQQIYETQQTLAKAQYAVTADQQNVADAQQQLSSAQATNTSTQSPTGTAQLQSAVRQAQSQLSQDQLAVSQAQNQLNTLQDRLNPTVKASISGTVSISDSTNSATGLPSMQIISDGQIIKGSVSEYDYDKIKPDTNVTVLPISSGDKLKGQILSISNVPSQNSSSNASASAALGSQSNNNVSYYDFKVKIDTKLVNGFNVQIKVPQDTIHIPQAALINSKKGRYVYQIIKGKAQKINVQVHENNGTWYLDNGLSLGDKIVTNPDNQLKAGQEVSSSAD